MSKKGGFWGNFWSETGTNAGKWASNKFFGPTGWATPRRYIFQGDDIPLKKTSSAVSKANAAATPARITEEDETAKQKLMALALQIEYTSNNPSDICGKLDDLLTAANKAVVLDVPLKVFEPKISSGIHRLQQAGDLHAASFYSQQWENLRKQNKQQQYLPLILLLIVSLVFLAIMQWMS